MMQNFKDNQWIKDTTEENFKQYFKRQNSVISDQFGKDFLYYTTIYERDDLMDYLLKNFNYSQFNLLNAFKACLEPQIKHPGKLLDVLLKYENVVLEILKQLSLSPYQSIFQEKNPELLEKIIPLIEKIMLDDNLVQNTNKWSLNLKNSQGKDILFYSIVFQRYDLTKYLMKRFIDSLNSYDRYLPKHSLDVWSAFQACLSTETDQDKYLDLLLNSNETVKLEIAQKIKKYKFQIIYQIKNTKNAEKIISFIIENNLTSNNIFDEKLYDLNWDKPQKEAFENWIKKLCKKEDFSQLHVLIKNIPSYISKFNSIDLFKYFYNLVYKIDSKVKKTQKSQINVWEEFQNACLSQNTLSPLRFEILRIYHKEYISHKLCDSEIKWSKIKDLNKLRQITLLLREINNTISNDQELLRKIKQTTDLYFEKVVKKEKTFKAYLRKELHEDLKNGLAQEGLFSLFRFERDDLMALFVKKIKKIQTKDKGINTGFWEVFQFCCMSDEKIAPSFVKILLEHDKAFLLNKLKLSKFDLFFETKNPEIQRQLLIMIKECSENIAQEKKLTCRLFEMLPIHSYDDIKKTDMHQYIVNDKEFFYWDANLQNPEKLNFLPGKKFEDFEKLLKLAIPRNPSRDEVYGSLNVVRNATLNDLRVITAFTGHVLDPISPQTFQKIEEIAVSHFFRWIKTASLEDIQKYMDTPWPLDLEANLNQDLIFSLYNFSRHDLLKFVLQSINKNNLFSEKTNAIIWDLFKAICADDSINAVEIYEVLLNNFNSKKFILEKLKDEDLNFFKQMKNPYLKYEIISLIEKESIKVYEKIEQFIKKYHQLEILIKHGKIYKDDRIEDRKENKQTIKQITFRQYFQSNIFQKENVRYMIGEIQLDTILLKNWKVDIKKGYGQDLFFLMKKYGRSDLIQYCCDVVPKKTIKTIWKQIKTIWKQSMPQNHWIINLKHGFLKDFLLALIEFKKITEINFYFSLIDKYLEKNPLDANQLNELWEVLQYYSQLDHEISIRFFDCIIQRYESDVFQKLQDSKFELLFEAKNNQIIEKIFSMITSKNLDKNIISFLFNRAAVLENKEVIDRLKKIYVNQPKKEGHSKIHQACKENNPVFIEKLCQLGVPYNEPDHDQCSPLDKISDLNILKHLLNLGLKPHKDGGEYLFKKLYCAYYKTIIESSNNLKKEVLKPTKQPKHLTYFCALFSHIQKEHHVAIIEFLFQKKAEPLLMKVILEKAFYIDKDLLKNNIELFLNLSLSQYKNLGYSCLDFDLNLIYLNHEKYLKNRKFIEEFMPLIKKFLLTESQQKIRIINSHPKINEFNELLKQECQNLKENHDLIKTKTLNLFKTKFQMDLPKDKKIKKLLFIYEKESTLYSNVVNKAIQETLQSLRKNDQKIGKWIEILILDSKQWGKWYQEKPQELSASIILFSGTADRDGRVKLGNSAVDANTCLSMLCHQNTREYQKGAWDLKIVYMNVIDDSEQFNIDQRKSNHFAPWIVLEKFKENYESLSCSFSSIFDLLFDLYVNQTKISDSCRSLALRRPQISLFETNNILSDNNNYFNPQKIETSQKPKSSTYLDFRATPNLKRSAVHIDFTKRTFSKKGIVFKTCLNKFAQPSFKQHLSFYNASPYDASLIDATSVLGCMDKTLHPWMLILSISMKEVEVAEENNKISNATEKKIVIYDKNETESYMNINTLFHLFKDKFGFFTGSIVFLDKPLNNTKFNFKNLSYLDVKFLKQIYTCAQIVFINHCPITDEFKEWFIDTFFDYMNKNASMEKAFYLTEKAYLGDGYFPMRMVKQPIDFKLHRPVDTFFLKNSYSTYHLHQRVKESTLLDFLSCRIEPTLIKNNLHLNLFGINSYTIDGRSLLLTAIMRDLFDIAKALLEYDDIDVHQIDPKSGNTALHIACAKFHVGLVKLILDKDAKVNLRNFKGHSALFYLFKFGGYLKEKQPEEQRKKMIQIYQMLKAKGMAYNEEFLSKQSKSWQSFSTKNKFDEAWNKREPLYLPWLQMMAQTPEKTLSYIPWESQLVVPSKQAWFDIITEFLKKSNNFEELGKSRRILYIDFNSRSQHSKHERLRYQAYETDILEEILSTETFKDLKKYINLDICRSWTTFEKLITNNKYWGIVYAGHAGPGYLIEPLSNGSNYSIGFSSVYSLIESNRSNSEPLSFLLLNGCETLTPKTIREFHQKSTSIDYIIGPNTTLNDSVGFSYFFNFFKNLLAGCSIQNAHLETLAEEKNDEFLIYMLAKKSITDEHHFLVKKIEVQLEPIISSGFFKAKEKEKQDENGYEHSGTYFDMKK